jgi:small subunit ribosomal protein S4
MARNIKALCKLCRREGEKLFLKGERCYTDKCAFVKRGYPPGQHGQHRRKLTPYGVHLREKQKVRRIYGISERQFRRFFEMAQRMKGITGENLLSLLERRLDNVVFRAGFAVNRNDARQLVAHGHIAVNGRKVTVPSFLLKVGDVVSVKPSSHGLKRIQEALAVAERRQAARYLDCDRQALKATLISLPTAEDAQALKGGAEEGSKPIRHDLIVEYYSK